MKKFEKSTLFLALRALSKKKVNKFADFIQTNNHVDVNVRRLFNIIKPNLLSPQKKFPSQSTLIIEVFSSKTAKPQDLRYVMSKLLSIYEDWLVQDYVQHDTIKKASILAQAYEQLNFPEGVLRAENALKKEQTRSGYKNDQYLLEDYQIEWSYFNSGAPISATEMPPKLDHLVDSLDRFYMSRQLQQIGVRLAYDTISKGGSFDKTRLRFFIQILEKQKQFLEEPCIYLYYLVVKMQLEPSNTTHFQNFVPQLFEHIHIFPPQEARSLWIFAINYCMRNRNEGFASYHRVMELYDVGLERNILTQDGKVTQTTLLNALKYGLKMNETKKMEGFLEKYKDLIKEDEAENTILESKARIAFSKKEYQKAINHLEGVKHQSLLSELSLRLLQFRILYEMEDMDRLEKHLHSLSMFFLRRKKQLGYHQKSLNNYIKAGTRLLKTNKYSKEERQAFQVFVKSLQPIFERDWFLEMSSN